MATTAAQMAVGLLQDNELPSDLEVEQVDNGQEQVPSVLLRPVVVTEENIQDTILADDFYSVDEICTQDYQEACQRAGIGQ